MNLSIELNEGQLNLLIAILSKITDSNDHRHKLLLLRVRELESRVKALSEEHVLK